MKILRIRDVKMPVRGTEGSAGIDLFVPNDQESIVLNPGESAFIPAGIKARVPHGYALVAMNKSGIAAKKSLMVGACVIDEDYTGEIHIDLKNVGTESQGINPGDKITQVLCLPVNYVTVEEASSEDEMFGDLVTERGAGGFGSTGTK
jgi:dUTP pyrophosphatase